MTPPQRFTMTISDEKATFCIKVAPDKIASNILPLSDETIEWGNFPNVLNLILPFNPVNGIINLSEAP